MSATVAGRVFTTSEMAKLARLSPARIRRCVRAGFLRPGRGSRRRFEYDLVDLLVLRATRTLLDAHVGPGRIARIVRQLRAQLGDGRDVASVRLSRDGTEIIASDGRERWQPESGQLLLSFAAERPAPVVLAIDGSDEDPAFEAFRRGLALENVSAGDARNAYHEALRLDPTAVPALVNLGRLEHEAGEHDTAEQHYQAALALDPEERTAAFNLAILAENQGRARLAVRRYRQVLQIAPDMADAHQRLARLLAGLGDHVAARRHMRCYRELHRHKRR